MTPSRPWGGLVPDDSTGPHNAREQFAEAGDAPQGAAPPSAAAPLEQAIACGRDVEAALDRLYQLECLRNTPAQMHPLTFEGSAKRYVHLSQHPPRALSVGVINPVELNVYLGLDGGRAAPNSHAVVVPPKSVMVIPVAVDKFELGVDPEALKEESATIFLLRYPTVQELFLGAM